MQIEPLQTLEASTLFKSASVADPESDNEAPVRDAHLVCAKWKTVVPIIC